MDIFYTRDIDGNESEEPFIPSDESDFEDEPETGKEPTTEANFDEMEQPTSEETPLEVKVHQALKYLDTINLKVADFLDGLSWSDVACTRNPKIKMERNILFQSPKLLNILKRWATPPRPKNSSKSRPKGASAVMNQFTVEHNTKTITDELNAISTCLKSPTALDVDEKTLTETSLHMLAQQMQSKMPILWMLLESVAYTSSQRQRNVHKNSEKIIVVIISMLSYSRSHHNNRFQKLMAIYLKFKGISAKGFDTLHAMGLTMSHKWSCDVVAKISDQCMDEVRKLVAEDSPWKISYDNIQVPFRVYSTRLDNQGEFGSGTAATVYFDRSAKPLGDDINVKLREKRAKGLKNPLNEMNLIDFAIESYPRIQIQAEYHVLRFLLDAPEFDLKTYSGRKSEHFKRPTPIDQLPCGPEHSTLQYILGTVNIPEASYEDNSRLVHEWLGQLGWGDRHEQLQTGLKRLVAWCGDQLTMDRLRGLFKYRSEDENSFERLDFSVFVFGWFHLQMAFANSLHKQYFGTTQGRGLHQAFVLLQKKGLSKILTKGPFHHDLEEGLYAVAEAHFREDWLAISSKTDLKDLRDYTPEQLRELARHIVQEHASNEAINLLEQYGEDKEDEQLHQVIMWNRDILQYIVLDYAIHEGDVGLMEYMLPHLFFRFNGGGNGKYAGEVLELLQGIHREWNPEVRDFVKHHCWLINTTGKPNMFCPVDQAQEHNIKDIKVTYRSEGPNIQWEYFKKLHPAIHIIRIVADHVEKEFGTYTRGKKHTTPNQHKDVETLQKTYHESTYHIYEAGRKIERKQDKAEDYITKGMSKIHTGKVLERWNYLRSFVRSVTENWAGLVSDDEQSAEEATNNGPESEGSEGSAGGSIW